MLVFGGTAAAIASIESDQSNLAKPGTEISQPEIIVVKSEQ